MIIYYGLILFILILGFLLCDLYDNKFNKNLFLSISFGLFVIISTFRYGIGFDYFSYKNIFENIASVPIYEITEVYTGEILFTYINKALSYLSNNYIIFLLFTNIFIYFSIMVFIYKYSKDFTISIFIFITFQFFAYSMNLLRQSLAVAVFLFSYQFIIEKKLIKFVLLIFISFLIHKSAIILIPIYFLLNIKVNSIYFKLVLVLMIFAYIFIDDIYGFLNIHSSYENTIYWNGNSFKYVVFHTIYFIFTMIFSNKLIKANDKNNILVNTTLYAFSINLFVTKHFIFERFSIYMFVFSIILLPEILFLYKSQNKKLYYILYFVLILMGILYFIFAAKEGFHNVYPYKSIFDKAISKGI